MTLTVEVLNCDLSVQLTLFHTRIGASADKELPADEKRVVIENAY